MTNKKKPASIEEFLEIYGEILDKSSKACGEVFREYLNEIRILVMSEREVVESHFG